MNANDPLSQLHDIIEAQAITWWPLALGWWILICIVTFALCTATVYLVKRHRRLLYKREALQELQELELRYFSSTPDFSTDAGNRAASKLNAEVNVFLKRVISSRQRTDVRAKTTDAWLLVLDQNFSELSKRERNMLAYGHYTPKAEHFDKAFFDSVKKWLKELR